MAVLKIVDVTEFYSERGGGVRSHLTTRGHVLRRLGHDHLAIAPGAGDDESALAGPADESKPSCGRARVRRIRGPALPYDPTYHLLGRLDRLRAVVRAERPDVLEAHSPYLAAAGVIACGRRGPREEHARHGRAGARVRTAFWHADHVGTYAEPALRHVVGDRLAPTLVRPLWLAVRGMLAPFDAVFTGGLAQAGHLRAAGVPNVQYVPFGVDVRIFQPAARSAARRHELVDGEREALLVGVGRFAVEKRWDVVLDAFEQVRARRPARLVLFGDGPEGERLKRRASPGVRFVGFERDRHRLATALASADVVVHGCPYETFGLSIAEAVACAVPVVVPDQGGAGESRDPSCGETYRSLDAAACAAAILRLLERDPSELRARALAAAGQVPTADAHFAQVLSVYDGLLRSC